MKNTRAKVTALVVALSLVGGVAIGTQIAQDNESAPAGPGAVQQAVDTIVPDSAIDDAKSIPDDVIR